MKAHIAIFIVSMILFSGCVSQPIELDSVEVREYKGEKLSSVNDFRENSIKGIQYVNSENYTLKITGLVDNPKELTYNEVIEKQSYTKIVTLYCVEGWDATILWEGVLIKDIVQESGVMESANTIIFHAYDGYTTSFPLDYVIDNDILLAYKMNNITIPPERGFPFQVIAEDKWGYKWIKWVTGIELSDNSEYRGYWEERGYNNDGDLSGSKFE